MSERQHMEKVFSFTLMLVATGLLGMGSQGVLYELAGDLVNKMITWSNECGGKTHAECSRNLTALRKAAYKAAEFSADMASDARTIKARTARPSVMERRVGRPTGDCMSNCSNITGSASTVTIQTSAGRNGRRLRKSNNVAVGYTAKNHDGLTFQMRLRNGCSDLFPVDIKCERSNRSVLARLVR